MDDGALARGMATIRKNYESSVAKGRMTADALERAMGLITPTTTYDGFDAVDIVVEAVFEDMALKTSTFADLGRVTRPDCVLASNTSTLDIDALARASGRGANVIGHHFFSPANVMKLVEIVRGRETGPETIATSQKLAKRLGKVGVVVGNCFGFVANRMLLQYLREAYLLLEEGASVAQIDRVMTAFGMPVGPFGMEDIAGLDVGARIREHLRGMGKTARADWPESEIANRLVEMGRFGQKTGAGWYRYEPGNRTPLVDPLIDTLAERAVSPPRDRAPRRLRRRGARARHHGARQRGRARARRRLREPRGRHRRHLLLRVRLPSVPRRPDVLCRYHRASDRARANPRVPPAGRRLLEAGASPRKAPNAAPHAGAWILHRGSS